MPENLGQMLLDACARFSDASALSDAQTALTYAQLSARAQTVANILRDRKVAANEPVLVNCANEPHDIAAFLGVWLAGGVAVPVARAAPAFAIEQTRGQTGARYFVSGAGDPVADSGHGRPPERPLLAGAALIIFTSGSTGLPKGVVLDHARFVRKLAAIDAKLNFSRQTRAFVPLQITFVFGLWVTLLALRSGGHAYMQSRFEAGAVLELLAKQTFSDAPFVPTMLRKLILLDESHAPFFAKVRLARILTGGEPFGRELLPEIRSRMPNTGVTDIYGLTETGTSDFFLMPDEQERHAGAIGRPSADVEFRIAGEAGVLPPGEVGELQIKTPYGMKGYLDAPDLTRAAFADDYFRTGDLARIRDDGMVELSGRVKDLIMRGGAKIAPLELDGILAEHPAIAAALTAGVPDAVLGQRIHALIVPRRGAAIDETEIRAWVKERLEAYKRPDTYSFAAELPLGRTGKVDRGALRTVK